MKALVWDELNSERDFAKEIELDTRDPDEFAKRYAETDIDGNADGIYSGHEGQPIMVELEDGTLFRVEVKTEYEPVYYASRTKQLTPRGTHDC